jgi:hypothetical protein
MESSTLMTDDIPENVSTVSSTDSLFCPTALKCNTAFSPSVSDDSSFSSADETVETCSTTSTTDFDNLGPPPPGSTMDFWNQPFSPSEFHDFPHLFRDGLVTTDDVIHELSSTDDCMSLSSTDSISNNLQHDPIIRKITATTRIEFNTDTSPTMSTTTFESSLLGELVDSGGNFCMCNNLDMLVNIEAIQPFGISMAATHEKTSPTCTHRGEFPIPMLDGSVLYTPMFYNPTASDCILSPQAICSNSNGYLVKWTQEGGTSSPTGNIVFHNKHGSPVIKLELSQRNGLYYTTTTSASMDVQSFRADISHDMGLQEEALLDLEHTNTAEANLNVEQPIRDPK